MPITPEEREIRRQRFLEIPRSMEPYATAFRNTSEGLASPDREVRMTARCEFMVFLRAHAEDFLSQFPEAIPDLIEILEFCQARHRKHGPAFLTDVAVLLELARRHLPAEEE